MCEFDYLLTYQLGLDKPSGKAANVGNALHKAMELFGNKKLCEQTGATHFTDQGTGISFLAKDITPELALEVGWNAYKTPEFTNKDYESVKQMIADMLSGPYSPLKQEIVKPEQYFDLEIPGDWATYEYKDPHSKEIISGRLAIRGAMDLLVRLFPGMLGYQDYKSGSKIDWTDPNKKEKNFESLMHDKQLLLYYYALKRLYPGEEILMTIIFNKVDGPTTLPYGEEQLEEAYQMIKTQFLAIKNSRIERIMDKPGRSGPCFSFCHWGKNQHQESGKRLCNYYWGELQQLGMERLTEKFGKPGFTLAYRDGGGVANRGASE